jgi:hypothetical protein
MAVFRAIHLFSHCQRGIKNKDCTLMMEIEQLVSEHFEMRGLLKVLSQASNGGIRRMLFADLNRKFDHHERHENEFLLSLVASDPKSLEKISHAAQGALWLRGHFIAMEKLSVESPHWAERFENLCRSLEGHFDYEEETFFGTAALRHDFQLDPGSNF